VSDDELKALVLEAMKVPPTDDFHYPLAPNQLRHLITQAVEAEREACEKVCEDVWNFRKGLETGTALECVVAIRARG
jgi:hypothetical protein